MNKLVAIALAGIAAFAMLLYFARPVETDLAPALEPGQLQPPLQQAGADTAPPPEPTPPPQLEPPKQASTAPAPKPTARLQAITPPPVPAYPRSARPAAASLTDEERRQLAACDATHKLATKLNQDLRDAETKDPAWAYRMEEQLRKYFSRRFQSSPIEVTGIDCKTSFCEIKAQTFSPEATIELSSAIHALIRDPPTDFRGMSSSNKEEAGQMLHVVQLNRNQGRIVEPDEPSAEQQACWKIANQQAQRERAARDAEPRDSGWADTMEQLLRQHITAALAKHPLERLEIACRSTFCEIKASGLTRQSQDAFLKVAQEVGAQPWADMLNGESGSSSYGDKWEGSQTLRRKESG